jgi:hypothetical protein
MGRDVIPKSVTIGSFIENSIKSSGQNHRTRDNDLSALRVPPPLLMSIISAPHRPYRTGRTTQAEGCPGPFGRSERDTGEEKE